MNNDLFSSVNKENAIPYKNNYYKSFFKRLHRRMSFIIPSILLFIIFFSSFISKILIDSNDYLKVNLDKAFLSPSVDYPFGTTEFGQNFFYLVLIGTFNTIILSLVASVINLIIGVLLGIVWGHHSKLDNIMLFIRNVINNIPLPFFYIIIISALGSGFFPILFVITFLGWVSIACLIRNNLLIIKSKDYNTYSRINNISFWKMLKYNYLPPLLPIIFSSFAICFPEIASLEVTLAYMGFSLGETNISLGYLLHNSLTSNNWFNHIHLFLIPLAIMFSINVSFYYIGKTISECAQKEDESCLK